MRIIKFVIFYTFIGIYESAIFVSTGVSKLKNLFSQAIIVPSRTATVKENAPQRMKGALLKTAFRSIL